MSKFKVDDLVRVIADNSPTQEGVHLIGKVGTVVTVAEEGTYKYRIDIGGHRIILAQANELEFAPVFKPGAKVWVVKDNHADNHSSHPIVGLQGEIISFNPNRRYGYEVLLEDKRTLRGSADELKLVTEDDISIKGVSLAEFESNLNKIESVLSGTEKAEAVEHPAHYGGDTPYEVIKVAEAWGFNENAYLFNALKYLARADKKGNKVEDLKKLVFYVNREIALEEAK